MLGFLWLIPVLPFAGFAILALSRHSFPHKSVTIIGLGSVGLSALLAILISASFLFSPPEGGAFTQTLWT